MAAPAVPLPPLPETIPVPPVGVLPLDPPRPPVFAVAPEPPAAEAPPVAVLPPDPPEPPAPPAETVLEPPVAGSKLPFEGDWLHAAARPSVAARPSGRDQRQNGDVGSACLVNAEITSLQCPQRLRVSHEFAEPTRAAETGLRIQGFRALGAGGGVTAPRTRGPSCRS